MSEDCVEASMDVRQPPWANELLARNRKVGRNIWSTSDIHQGTTSFTFEFDKGQVEDHARKRTEHNKVVDPSSSLLTKATTTTVLGTGNPIHEDNGGLCDPSAKESNLASGGVMRQKLWTLSNNSGEESIIEYGPGIVSKLRSKYQSLSARQHSIRPSIRRSTSLEHNLDFVQSETPIPTLPSPRGREESPSPVIPPVEKQDGNRAARAKMTLTVHPHPTYGKVANNNTTNIRPVNKGRAGNSEQQNQMRRARSVDALHHAEFTPQEEEILEKFKELVLPKEEVVIIEMSKPRLNIGSLGHHLPGRTNETKLDNALATHHYAISSLTTPEHELPPHDIVRDTAKIFETNPGAHWKKVGHALRLCQSPSLSPASSLCSSPLPFPLSPTPVVTATEKKVQIVSALPHRAAIFDQNEDSPTRTMNNFQQNNKLESKNIVVGVGIGTGPGVNPQTNSPAKQVGIIRPTVNGVQKSFTGSKMSRPTPPPPLPPRETLPTSPANRAFQFITAPSKPALSPKPPLPSKPKELLEHFKVPKFPRSLTVDETIGREKSPEPSIGVPPAPPLRLETPVTLELNLNLGVNVQKNLNSGSSSPVSSKAASPSPTGEAKGPVVVSKINAAFPVTLKPVVGPTVQKSKESLQTQGVDSTKTNDSSKPIASESQNNFSKQPYNDTQLPKNNNVKDLDVQTTRPPPVSSSQKNAREGDALKHKSSSPPPVRKDPEEKSAPPAVSQLRFHQKQKSQQSNGGGTMVFNFTSRNKVPDYIEDDGLHRLSSNGADEEVDDTVDGSERFDPKLIFFIGENVIINGRSSIQKKPKSQKMSIRFNEAGTTTFEYPSETSVVNAEETNNTGSNNNLVPGNASGALNLSGGGGGGGLSSYTPSKVAPNSYQLGFYREGNGTDTNSNRKSPMEPKNIRTGDSDGDAIEDYLKPDTGSTTWSSEIGGADILF